MISNPNLLNILGLLFSIFGGIYLAIDSLGALDIYNQTKNNSQRKHSLSGPAFLNSADKLYLVLTIDITGSIILYFTLTRHSLSATLICAPIVYLIWRLNIFFWEMLHKLIGSANPLNLVKPNNIARIMVFYLGILLWRPFYSISFWVSHFFTHSANTPMKWIARNLFTRITFGVYERLAAIQKVEREYAIRLKAFYGLILMVTGFAYQLTAAIILFK